MAGTTPEEWLARFNATIDDAKARAAEFQANLERSGATETAPDGSLSVSVAPNGSLTDLRIDESAMRGNGAELAARIMALARKAQRAAAVNVAEAFAPLGADSEAMHMITGYLPEPEPETPEPRAGYSFNAADDAGEETPPPRRVEPSHGQPRPRLREDDGDDDFGDDQIFGGRR
jgi:DNA-binding protein YbaB